MIISVPSVRLRTVCADEGTLPLRASSICAGTIESVLPTRASAVA